MSDPQQCVRAAIRAEPPDVRQQEALEVAKPRRDSHQAPLALGQSDAGVAVRSRMASLELSPASQRSVNPVLHAER
ncbi:hypothetical protein GGH95_002238 [Coemansia sp. RSA 1836]|nr:hypothetical protein GGI00_000602 [Coemansia sp. RSA 2681]KAJ2495337.1 hypothetical protein IWW47_004120 [Coemansia sp. RSA 2052]KAJ2581124.1 hypothetical protein GGH95_002238 [Coemansia sp. RSA 1836]